MASIHIEAQMTSSSICHEQPFQQEQEEGDEDKPEVQVESGNKQGEKGPEEEGQ